jgi:leucyl-tRNA synthetase
MSQCCIAMQRSAACQVGRFLRPWSSRARHYDPHKLASTGLSGHFRSPIAVRSYATKLSLPELDRKWQQMWESQTPNGAPSNNTSAASLTNTVSGDNVSSNGQTLKGQKMYILPMFPYPSGNLHLGHFRNYTIPDVLARFRRMQGHDVLLPMGWDAFGLPAENAAIERGIDPAVWTRDNIAKMKKQLRAMNGSWDWSRELTTCDKSYYKHTQKLFLLLHKHGLAYQAESLVNYDPVDKTVLANEQVDANGCSWRSGAKVEKKMLKQWFLKISAFRDALLDDLEVLAQDGRWPERVLSMQRNWLGKSSGARIKFQVMSFSAGSKPHSIEVFTTRPDTLFGVQYIALAASHPLVLEKAKEDGKLQEFVNGMASLPPDSKDGYLLQGVRAINPLAFDPATPDASKASLPVYVAPYVLADYGDGAVMGVPGHDTRDNAFWKQNCAGQPIRMVVAKSSTTPEQGSATRAAPSEERGWGSFTTPHGKFGLNSRKIEPIATASDVPEVTPDQDAFTHDGTLTAHSGKFAGKPSKEAGKEIVELLKANELGEATETWRLRDWLVSRQRYWGAPIPMIHCDSCGPVPVPEDQLPVELPKVDSHWLAGKTGNPLDHAHDWVNTTCPSCHEPAKRDTDTMDTFVDSSWYMMRFTDPHNEDTLFTEEAANKLLPVDLYIGGVEHAILHLLYARFISKFLASINLWPAGSDASLDHRGEPFKRLLTQGMVHGRTFTDPSTGRFLKPEEVDISNPQKPVIVATGEVPNVSFEKMSKSKYNGVNPTATIERYGADATRAQMLFAAPVSEVLEWDEGKISGVTRWLGRIYDLAIAHEGALASPEKVGSVEAYFQKRLKSSEGFGAGEKEKWEKEVQLWLAVERTVASVTTSLDTAGQLNTVVSDLMTLTNTLLGALPTANGASSDLEEIHKYALSTLLRLLAPVTPALVEECWAVLHAPQTVPSVFKSSFPPPLPEPLLSELERQGRQTVPCAVQINGKLKFAVDIAALPEGSETDLKEWVVRQVLQSEEARKRGLYDSRDGEREGEKTTDVAKCKKVVVVRGGRTVSFVV